jgi:hypothetical protein
MNLRIKFVLAAWLAFIPFAMPTLALADAAQPVAATTAEVSPPASMVCPQPGDQKLNIAQTSPADCCKAHKGVCGCRAGKIICCDRTPSDQPGCTCHGDDGFLE